MVRNARYEKIWFPHFWNFWVCYFSAKAELISSFFMSSALRQSLAAWNGLQRGCFQIFLHRICISLLLFLHFPTVYICNSPLLYFYFSLGMERLVENMGKALERVCRRMGGATFTFTTSWHHAMLRHLLSFVCDPQYCVHIQSQVTTAFHSHCIGTCSKFHRQRSLKRMCIVIERSILTQIISQLWTHTLWCSLHRTWIYSCA